MKITFPTGRQPRRGMHRYPGRPKTPFAAWLAGERLRIRDQHATARDHIRTARHDAKQRAAVALELAHRTRMEAP